MLCMTMFSFRVEEQEAEKARRWADRLGIARSQLLRDALHRYLVKLNAESDIESWARKPLSSEESALSDVADWGPAEDWSDWDCCNAVRCGSPRHLVATGQF
jgi:hypothetical protein